MDSMRGNYGSLAESGYEPADDDGPQTPPPAIGQDERRMQVRAYNHWAGLLEDRNFPAIEELEPDKLPDFGPYSVLLDFSTGIENPGISYLGDKLAEECGVGGEEMTTLDDVPARSLLTRITDHYMQILANQAPIGFEAEFVNQRGATIAYRGILLPFSSDDDTICKFLMLAPRFFRSHGIQPVPAVKNVAHSSRSSRIQHLLWQYASQRSGVARMPWTGRRGRPEPHTLGVVFRREGAADSPLQEAGWSGRHPHSRRDPEAP
jgi:hypothetical protein